MLSGKDRSDGQNVRKQGPVSLPRQTRTKTAFKSFECSIKVTNRTYLIQFMGKGRVISQDMVSIVILTWPFSLISKRGKQLWMLE